MYCSLNTATYFLFLQLILSMLPNCSIFGAPQNSTLSGLHLYRRQITEKREPGYSESYAVGPQAPKDYQSMETPYPLPKHGGMAQGNAANQAANRFTTRTWVRKIKKRTPPDRITFDEQCDYLARYCSKAYLTGKVCGRSIYYTYYCFKNYCLLDYTNCMERYEIWQVAHMGACYELKDVTEYIHERYIEDEFLDHYYVPDDQDLPVT